MPPRPPPTITFDTVDEIHKFFMNSALCQAWNRNHKIVKFHQLFQKLLVMGALHLRFLFCKLCVMINFSLRHNVLCFSFVVVLYSMYSFYAIIKVVPLDERDCYV